MESLDFMTFVRTVLDPSLALDKFEVGSIQIAPTVWPTADTRVKKDRRVLQHTKKNSTDRTTLDKSCQKINATHDQSSTLVKSCQKNHDTHDQSTPVKNRQKNATRDQSTLAKNCGVINQKAGSTVSCGSSAPMVVLPVDDSNTFLDVKLEASKRKLREQYDKIENEKKRRRVQIVEFQKPAAVQVQTKARRPLVVKKKPTQGNGLQLLRPAAIQLHRTHHVSVC